MIIIEFISSPDKEILGQWKTNKDRFRIGRIARNDIIIDDPGISKSHLEINHKKNNLIICTLDESEFYYSNGKKIIGTKMHKLNDLVRIGDTTFKIINIDNRADKDYSKDISEGYDKIISSSTDMKSVLKMIETEILWLEKEVNARK